VTDSTDSSGIKALCIHNAAEIQSVSVSNTEVSLLLFSERKDKTSFLVNRCVHLFLIIRHSLFGFVE